jgi:hypothetical protein
MRNNPAASMLPVTELVVVLVACLVRLDLGWPVQTQAAVILIEVEVPHTTKSLSILLEVYL